MAAQWVGQFSHRISMLAVAAQGVVNEKEHPTHVILADFADSLGEIASSLKELQKELEVSANPGSIELQQRDMEAELTAVEQLVMAQKAQSPLVAILSCPFLMAKLQACRERLSRDIDSIVPDACSAVVKLQIARTQRLLKQSPNLQDLAALMTSAQGCWKSWIFLCRPSWSNSTRESQVTSAGREEVKRYSMRGVQSSGQQCSSQKAQKPHISNLHNF